MTLIIAEAGVNHNGSEDLAFELIDIAIEAGADIVKFQIGKASELVSKSAEQAKYQQLNTGVNESQLKMLERLELKYDAHYRLQKYCQKKGIEFLTTAFESNSLKYIMDSLKLKRLKVASGELTNAPFLLQHARSGLDLILSTGMSNLKEIEEALNVIAFGLIAPPNLAPSKSAFKAAYTSTAGQEALKKKVTLLHCTTDYPAAIQDINLRAMDTIQKSFNIPVGYSDHSSGFNIAIAAVARGATVLEKHFTLDRRLPGPDHKASLEPDELCEMIKAIREVEVALGDGIKLPKKSELANRAVARKSLVASTNIIKGETFTAHNIAIKRPGNGISPMEYWDTLGSTSKKDYNIDDII